MQNKSAPSNVKTPNDLMPPEQPKVSTADQKQLETLQKSYDDLKAKTEKAVGEKQLVLLKEKGEAMRQINEFKAAHGL